jgi:uncharacterized phage protein gp47/JayE
MALPTVGSASYPTPDEVLGAILAALRYSYSRAGLTVNVAKGSEPYIRAKVFADRVSIALANNEIALTNFSPLDATGDDLTELASVFGITKRPAAAAAGLVTIGVATGSVTIPAGFQCTSALGIQYQTTSSVTVSNGDTVAVQAVSTGSDTNLAATSIVTWDSAAIGSLLQTATVAAGGIDGGVAEDTDEVLRTRLLRRLQFPAVGGNAAQVAAWAEEATAAVQVAFVYPAVRGPSSYDVVVVSSDADRALSTANVNTIEAAILGQMPGSADLNCTTVNGQAVDIIVNTTLPLPVNAGGGGGGWRDNAPWPSTADAAGTFARVTSIANLLTNRQITVNSTAADPPVAGKRFGIWNPTGGSAGTGEMHEFTIQAVGGAPGAYVITIDSASDAIDFITTWMYCSAGAVNLKTYAADFLAAMQLLGPGEKTTNTDILPRGRRTPGPDLEYPTDLTSLLLASVSNEHDEILNMTYAATYDTGTVVARTSPGVPATTADPPRILTLQNLSFRRQV